MNFHGPTITFHMDQFIWLLTKLLIWSFGGRWRFLPGGWHLDLDLDMVTGLWYTHDPNFGSLSWFWRWKEHPCPLSPHLGLWRMLEVPGWGVGILILIWICSMVFYTLMIRTLAPYLGMKVQKKFMSFKSSFGVLEDAGGSWQGFWHLDFDLDMVKGQ